MSNNNPYQSPESIRQHQSWWTGIKQRFRHWWLHTEPVFENGDALIYSGIAFFIDLDNSEVLYAASPATDRSQKRFDLVVSEAIKHLPGFLTEYPDVKPLLYGRKLQVRLIKDYATYNGEFFLEQEFEQDVLAQILDNNVEDKGTSE